MCRPQNQCDNGLVCVDDFCRDDDETDVDAGNTESPDAGLAITIDAAPPDAATALPDVTGEFYLAVETPTSANQYLEFLVVTTLDQNSSMLSMTLQPLCTNQSSCAQLGVPVGSAFAATDAQVDAAGEFASSITNADILEAANPLGGGDLVVNLQITGSIKTADLFCGLVDGTAAFLSSSTSVDGSTFGALRVPSGSPMPQALAGCPSP